MWIIAAKLPNSDLNFAVDFFWWICFPRKKAQKDPPKNPPNSSPGNLFRKIPLGFLQKPSLDILESLFRKLITVFGVLATIFGDFVHFLGGESVTISGELVTRNWTRSI